jgi:glycosyltransferase involved in cell wall biosynthesis
MGEALVSVIIPVFNGQLFVERTLESALAQTHYPLEIVVVDDGSTDETRAIVEAAAARDTRIRFFRRSHFGLSATRNFAISQARGNLIAPLDADDLWHPEKIARQTAVMLGSSSNVGVIYCWSVDIDENDLIIPPVRDKCTVQGNVVAELAARGNFLENGSAPLIRREYISVAGGYDETKLVQGSEDWKFYLSLAEICDFGVVPAHMVGYRRSSTNMSRNTIAMQQSIDYVERWIVDKWPDLPPKVKRQMFYHSNGYLAHQALTKNDFIEAIRYQSRSIRAEPSALLARRSLIFGIRFLMRLLRINKHLAPLRAKPIPFKYFRPESKAPGPNSAPGSGR